MGSLHGRAIRLPVPRKSHEPRRDGSRAANITPSVADKKPFARKARCSLEFSLTASGLGIESLDFFHLGGSVALRRDTTGSDRS